MLFDVITIFPQFFDSPLLVGFLKRALDKKIIEVRITDLRDFATDRHRTVDDRPFGGGRGMVLKPEPIFKAVEAVRHSEDEVKAAVILLSPQGRPFGQQEAERLSKKEQIILICGRYEGVDERVRQQLITEEISIGDYVLAGGELPALVVMEAVTRLLPSAVGSPQSLIDESFCQGILDFPCYTRPASFRGMRVPEVLLMGNHEEIKRWRKRKALENTLRKRPNLLARAQLDSEAIKMLAKLKGELNLSSK